MRKKFFYLAQLEDIRYPQIYLLEGTNFTPRVGKLVPKEISDNHFLMSIDKWHFGKRWRVMKVFSGHTAVVLEAISVIDNASASNGLRLCLQEIVRSSFIAGYETKATKR